MLKAYVISLQILQVMHPQEKQWICFLCYKRVLDNYHSWEKNMIYWFFYIYVDILLEWHILILFKLYMEI